MIRSSKKSAYVARYALHIDISDMHDNVEDVHQLLKRGMPDAVVSAGCESYRVATHVSDGAVPLLIIFPIFFGSERKKCLQGICISTHTHALLLVIALREEATASSRR
jgi:hypothetical protein